MNCFFFFLNNYQIHSPFTSWSHKPLTNNYHNCNITRRMWNKPHSEVISQYLRNYLIELKVKLKDKRQIYSTGLLLFCPFGGSRPPPASPVALLPHLALTSSSRPSITLAVCLPGYWLWMERKTWFLLAICCYQTKRRFLALCRQS